MTRHVRMWSGAALVVASFWGLGTAQGATISAPGLNATVTSAISPTRLPKAGSAPVTLTTKGTITATDGALHPLRAVELRLDRQLDTDATGLPTCTIAKVNGATVQQARQRCGKALVGSGSLTTEYRFLEEPPFYGSASLLFFNAGGGGVLVYAFLSKGLVGPGSATSIGRGTARGRALDVPLPDRAIGGATVAFQFRFGKTWQFKGQERSYLNGRCVTGTLTSRIALTTVSGERAMGTLPQECTSKAR